MSTTKKIENEVIAKLSKSPLKAEEILFMEEIAQSVQGDTYLKDLFSPDMVGWVNNQIRSDFSPSLYEFFRQTEDERDQAKRDLGAVANQKDLMISYRDTIIEEKEANIILLGKSIEHLRSDYQDARITISGQLEEIEQMRKYLEQTQWEVIQLKAKLYDLIA